LKSCNFDFDFILVLSAGDFQTRISNFYLADKANDWIDYNDANKIVLIRFLDFNKLPKSNKKVLRSEIVLFLVLIKNFRNIRKIIKYYKSEINSNKTTLSRIIEMSWKILLDELKPRSVLGIGLSYELISVCIDRKIPTAEIQHGLISSSTISYYWSKYNKNNKKIAPAFFLCWDRNDAIIVSEHEIIPIIVGYPKPISTGTKPIEQIYDFGVTLTHAHIGSADPFECVPTEIIEFMEWANQRDFRMAVRIHPVSWLNLKSRLGLVDWLLKKFSNIQI
jgi:hypothetical protein